MPVDVDPTPVVQRQLGGKLAGLSLPRQVAVLAIWPMLEQCLSFLVGMVDLMLAGRLEPEALAIAATDALGTAGYVGWLMGMFHSSVGIGATALIARAIGGKHRRLANGALGQALLLALGSGMLMAAFVFIMARPIGMLVGLHDTSLAACTTYLQIVAMAAPASAIMLVGNAALRGSGDTKTPFLIMVVVNLVNIGLSILLVFGPGPFGGHGVAGIATGTAVAWCVGAVLCLIVLLSGWGGIRLHLHRLRPRWHTARRILRVGLPNLIEGVGMLWLGNFIVLKIVGSLGTDGVIGAHMIAIRFESASFLPGFALGIAAAALCGQYLGLGDPQRAARAVKLAWLYAAIIMTALGVLFFAIPHLLVGLITDVPALVNKAIVPLQICGPIQIFFATNAVLASALRGAGDTRATLYITAGSTFLLRVPAVYILGVTFDMGLNGIWIALCSEISFRSLLVYWRFRSGAWTRIQV
jgi:putative MATE family efflux protein